MPFGPGAAVHALVVGATGSGKTVTQTQLAVAAVGRGHGRGRRRPEGGPDLRGALVGAAGASGRRFVEWTPAGGSVYNPFASGGDSEIADKALAGEHFTEPHYMRQAQRYIGHVARCLRAAGIELCPRRWPSTWTRSGSRTLARGLAGHGRHARVPGDPDEQAAIRPRRGP